jgi:hypothetical protein
VNLEPGEEFFFVVAVVGHIALLDALALPIDFAWIAH